MLRLVQHARPNLQTRHFLQVLGERAMNPPRIKPPYFRLFFLMSPLIPNRNFRRLSSHVHFLLPRQPKPDRVPAKGRISISPRPFYDRNQGITSAMTNQITCKNCGGATA